jgi:hypothetical protein
MTSWLAVSFHTFVLEPFNDYFKSVVDLMHASFGPKGNVYPLPFESGILLDFVACWLVSFALCLPLTTTVWLHRDRLSKQISKFTLNDSKFYQWIKFIVLFGWLVRCISWCLACPRTCYNCLCCKKENSNIATNSSSSLQPKSFKFRVKGAEFYKQITLSNPSIAVLRAVIAARIGKDFVVSQIIAETDMMLVEDNDDVQSLKDGSVLGVVLRPKSAKEIVKEILDQVRETSFVEVKKRGNF